MKKFAKDIALIILKDNAFKVTSSLNKCAVWKSNLCFCPYRDKVTYYSFNNLLVKIFIN